MSVKFTLLNQQNVAVVDTQAKDVVVNEVFSGTADGKLKQVVTLSQGGSPVALNSVFSKFMTSVSSTDNTDGDILAPVDLLNSTSSIVVGAAGGFNHTDGTTNTLTIAPSVRADAVPGDFTLTVELHNEADEVVYHQAITLTIVTGEQALTRYESIVANISTEDLATIDAARVEVENAQAVALTAVNALSDGSDKTALTTRYSTALANQHQAYKLLYLYLAKNNTLTLFKVKNVGGNVPYSIVLKDDVLVGSASEAFVYLPAGSKAAGVAISDDAEALPLTITDPKQTSINVGNYATGGDFTVIFKINDVYHKVYFTTDSSGKVLQSVNGVAVSGIDSAGTSFIPSGQEVSKVDLAAALSKANGYLTSYPVGVVAGDVPQAQHDVLATAVAAAQAVADNADAQVDEVNAATATLNAASAEFLTYVVKYTVDETGLQKAVDDANKLVATAVVGTNVGQTTQASVDAYKAAIASAQKVLDDTPSTVDYNDKATFDAYEAAVAKAITDLSAATTVYTSSIVTTLAFATKRVEEYEAAATAFLNSVRKKIRI